MTFVIQNTFLSKNDSVVTGSLQITSTISARHSGTASYVLTSSYSENSSVSSFTSATSIDTASYTTYAVSSSLASTASSVSGLYYGPNSNIGSLSPIIHIGSPDTFTNNIFTNSTFNGILLSPILINKPCTLTTMSITGGSTGVLTASLGIYSNSNTTNLPEYLLASGSLTTNAVVGPVVFNVTNFSSINLNANTVYWVAFLPSAAVNSISPWKWLYSGLANTTYYAANPLLYGRVSYVSASSASPLWAIRTGSNPTTAGPFLPLTASQNTASYSLPASQNNPCILPVLRVTYP